MKNGASIKTIMEPASEIRVIREADVVNNDYNLIPHCTLYGQAAGTAAALSVKTGVNVRNVNIDDLKDHLINQKVVIPENLPAAKFKGSTAALKAESPL